jgi:glycerate 2-kinase
VTAPTFTSLRVVVAPDSFKGSASATAAARAIAEGWRAVRPQDDLILLPMADGGEGTIDALAVGAPLSARQARRVTGPDGRAVSAAWLLLGDGTAVIETAQTSGLPLMACPDALGATSRGLGELLASLARNRWVRRIVLGLGGSATTDGGAGALEALGVRRTAAGLDLAGLAAPPPGGVACLVDVTAPLLGPRGAAHQFGPQKGATPEDVEALEERLRCWADLTGGDAARPGSGAAGGIAFGLATLWGAQLTPGAPYVAGALGLGTAIADADLVVTGEGSFDEQSLQGKATGYVLETARDAGRPVVVVCGRAGLRSQPGVAGIVETVSLAPSPEASMADAPRWLAEVGRRVAHVAGRPRRRADA